MERDSVAAIWFGGATGPREGCVWSWVSLGKIFFLVCKSRGNEFMPKGVQVVKDDLRSNLQAQIRHQGLDQTIALKPMASGIQNGLDGTGFQIW